MCNCICDWFVCIYSNNNELCCAGTRQLPVPPRGHLGDATGETLDVAMQPCTRRTQKNCALLAKASTLEELCPLWIVSNLFYSQRGGANVPGPMFGVPCPFLGRCDLGGWRASMGKAGCNSSKTDTCGMKERTPRLNRLDLSS